MFPFIGYGNPDNNIESLSVRTGVTMSAYLSVCSNVITQERLESMQIKFDTGEI
jgi:hypothetical protein